MEKGAKVAILLPNCTEYFFAFFGNCEFGAVTVPVNPMLKEGEMAYTLNHSDTETLIFSKTHKDLILSFVSAGKIPNVNRFIYVGNDPPKNALSIKTLIN